MSLAGLDAALSVAAARRRLTQAFADAGLESAALDARILVGQALGLDHAGVAAAADQPLGAAEAERLGALAQRRLAREPVSRIVGMREFWGLPIRVTPAVLVPRPESETLIEAVLQILVTERWQSRPLRLADLGTGSGALLLALLHEQPNIFGVGTDVSPAALNVAHENAGRCGVAARASFVACDFGAALAGGFDLMVSNPPYVATRDICGLDPEVRDHDPRLALDGGRDGLDGYRSIAQDAKRLLGPYGHLVVELGAGQEGMVGALFTQFGFGVMSPARRDLGGVPRALHVKRLS